MKLIDKDALVAEIERRIKVLQNNPYENHKTICHLDSLKQSLDTLEVKEVNLEDVKKEELAQKYVDYTFKRHNIDPSSKEGQLIYYAYMHGMNQCLTQLRVQKGEGYDR